MATIRGEGSRPHRRGVLQVGSLPDCLSDLPQHRGWRGLHWRSCFCRSVGPGCVVDGRAQRRGPMGSSRRTTEDLKGRAPRNLRQPSPGCAVSCRELSPSRRSPPRREPAANENPGQQSHEFASFDADLRRHEAFSGNHLPVRLPEPSRRTSLVLIRSRRTWKPPPRAFCSPLRTSPHHRARSPRARLL